MLCDWGSLSQCVVARLDADGFRDLAEGSVYHHAHTHTHTP